MALLACVEASCSSSRPVAASSHTIGRPNIVFVLTDDLATNLVQYMPCVATDPHELRNTFWSLSAERKASLHARLEALRSCRGAETCQEAARGGRGPTRQ